MTHKAIIASSLLENFIRTLYLIRFTIWLPKRTGFAKRSMISIAIMLAGTAALVWLDIFTQGNMQSLSRALWLPVAMMALAVTYNARPILYFFWSIVPMSAYSLSRNLNLLLNIDMELPQFTKYISALLVYAFSGLFVYFLMVRAPRDGSKRRKHNRIFLLVVAILITLFAVLSSPSQTISGKDYYLVESLLSMLSLVLLYVFEIEYDLRDNYEKLHELLEKDRIRYEVSKEYTEFINMKFHDIKHQIHKLRGRQSIDSEYLDQLESAIRLYDTDLQTGNEALDIILTEKNRLCAEKHIETTIIADGKSLAFLSASDLYSIFGNILDNAIEAVEKLPDDEMKQISMVAAVESGVIRIRVQNYFAEEPQMDGEESFRTTKRDAKAHGFGIKSVKYIIEKYDGAVSTEIHGNVFTINILLPQKD